MLIVLLDYSQSMLTIVIRFFICFFTCIILLFHTILILTSMIVLDESLVYLNMYILPFYMIIILLLHISWDQYHVSYLTLDSIFNPMPIFFYMERWNARFHVHPIF